MAIKVLDLNADLGETEDDFLELITIISSANIACGGHAGGGELLAAAVKAAIANNVQIGAHPSYPDRDNFGRISMKDNLPEDFISQLVIQIEKVKDEAAKHGKSLSHIKAHGALYNDAMEDEEIALLLVKLAKNFDLPLMGLPNSMLAKCCLLNGVRFIAEGFVDRAFTDGLTLVPRNEEGAVLDEDQALRQVIEVVTTGKVTTKSGLRIDLPIRTICVHGDTPHAATTARRVKQELIALGVEVSEFSEH
jgi:UPF0271 protein